MRLVILLCLAAQCAYGQIVAPFLVSSSSAPAITFGQENINSMATNSAAHTLSLAITDADLIIVCVSATWAAPTGVTFNGDALTEQTSREYSGYGSFIYTRANPDVGTYNVVVSWAGATDAVVTAIGWKKTHNTTPVSGANEAEGTSTSPGVTITSATGAVVIDCMTWYQETATASVGGSQTQKTNSTIGDCGGGVSTKAGAASVNMAWTISASRDWSHTGISINPE